jgi:thioredoxin reductase
MLRQWTHDIVLFTDGPGRLESDERARLEREGIPVRSECIARLEGDGGMLQRVILRNGDTVERSALFFNTGQHQRSPLATQLGCRFTSRGGVKTHALHVATDVPGLYVAGDASRDVQLVAVAAAEGVGAAFAINRALLKRAGLI